MATIYTVLGSSLLLEWAADQAATIYEDTGGSDTAEDGDSVASWRSTANGSLSLLASQSTALNRPIYRANYASSGYPGIEFDGSNDGLLIPHNSALNITNQTIVMVLKADAISAWRFAISRVGDSGWSQGVHVTAQNSTEITFGVNQATPASGVQTGTANRVIVCARYNGTSVEVWLNDTEINAFRRSISVSSHSQQGGIGNGGGVGGNYPWDGAIQHILWCNGACSRTAIEYVINALGDRWGISITDPPSIGGGTSGFTGLSGVGRLGT